VSEIFDPVSVAQERGRRRVFLRVVAALFGRSKICLATRRDDLRIARDRAYCNHTHRAPEMNIGDHSRESAAYLSIVTLERRVAPFRFSHSPAVDVSIEKYHSTVLFPSHLCGWDLACTVLLHTVLYCTTELFVLALQ